MTNYVMRLVVFGVGRSKTKEADVVQAVLRGISSLQTSSRIPFQCGLPQRQYYPLGG